jgi:TM2 domain-containing membrane protein YozV
MSTKSRTAAFLLAFFLGTLGAHRFYVGKTGSALAMLLVSLTFVGLLITGIWAIVDAIVIASGSFRDRAGNPLKAW